MHLAVLREPLPAERRVAATPRIVRQWTEAGHSVSVAAGAGERSGFSDDDYEGAGAEVGGAPGELSVLVGPPPASTIEAIPEGTALIGFLEPLTNSELLAAMRERRLTAFGFETVPRTTLAQMVDALSSQATAAGYAAVLMAAAATPRYLPMLTTAAGTIPPAKVLVLGTGVAGLQAIATARRLGAVTSAYDIRPEAREQVESLGARFVAAPVAEEASVAGGYAAEVQQEMQQRQLEALAPVVAESDIVIATAQIPGRPAPLLVTRQMVEAMHPGSIVVDVAAATGGNCEVTVPNDEIEIGGVTVMGPTDLASRVAVDASEMYARNVANFVEMLAPEGDLVIDFDNEIIDGACVTHAGEVRHPRSRALLGLT